MSRTLSSVAAESPDLCPLGQPRRRRTCKSAYRLLLVFCKGTNLVSFVKIFKPIRTFLCAFCCSLLSRLQAHGKSYIFITRVVLFTS